MSSQQGPKAAPGQHSAHILLWFILREPQSTSANFLGNVGGGTDGGPALVPGGIPPAHRWLYAMLELQHEAGLRFIDARHRGLPGKVREAAA